MQKILACQNAITLFILQKRHIKTQEKNKEFEISKVPHVKETKRTKVQ